MGYGLAAAGGLEAAQQGLRQRLMDQMLLEKQKQDMAIQLREQALREQEASQRNDLLKQNADERAAALTERTAAAHAGQAEQGLKNIGMGGDVTDQQFNQTYKGTPAESVVPPLMTLPGRMLSPVAGDTRTAPIQQTAQGIHRSLGTPQQQQTAAKDQIIGRLIDQSPAGSPQRMSLEYNRATGDNPPAGVFEKAAKPTTQPVMRVNPRTGQMESLGDAPANAHFVTEPQAKDTSAADAGRTDRSYQFHRNALDKLAQPLEQQQQRMGRLIETINQGSPQADALVAPELLTVMAGGSGSGLRMNEAEISRITGGRSQWENLKATLQQWSTDPTKANSITPEQRKQIRDLVGAVHAKSEAALQVVNEAGDQLVSSDVNGHRTILADARKKLQGVASGKTEETPEQRKARLRHAAGL